MNWIAVLIGAGSLTVMGILIGLLLGFANKALQVPTDDLFEEIRTQLPGTNCGGCGFAGCDEMAHAIANGIAMPSKCVGCGEQERAAIAVLIGKEDISPVRMIARVHCNGTCHSARMQYRYEGISDCRYAALLPGQGAKACEEGCMGLGSCVSACPTGAIHVADGCAQVEPSLCIGCGACVRSCPRHIIELLPINVTYTVLCTSHKKGKAVRAICTAGCIGCGICVKTCTKNAISLQNGLAVINYTLCDGCGHCAEKCPTHVIALLYPSEKRILKNTEETDTVKEQTERSKEKNI